jgi:hypothetical protein
MEMSDWSWELVEAGVKENERSERWAEHGVRKSWEASLSEQRRQRMSSRAASSMQLGK